MGAIKTLLAKVYLTMAGYPLQKGNEYYQLAYEKARRLLIVEPLACSLIIRICVRQKTKIVVSIFL